MHENEENPMSESVEVDLSKHMQPRGFAENPHQQSMNSAQMFDHPHAASSSPTEHFVSVNQKHKN